MKFGLGDHLVSFNKEVALIFNEVMMTGPHAWAGSSYSHFGRMCEMIMRAYVD
jgi:hypothetical protein